jgi:uncharacterized protein YggE
MFRMKSLLPALLALLTSFAFAQNAPAGPQTAGAVVVIPAYGEIRHPNDEARLTFSIEEQDKDKAQAASRVNAKMKRGNEVLKREDPSARLQTRGYYTYPVYAEEPQPRPATTNRPRQIIGWRVGQSLEATTNRLDTLPNMVASVQSVLALNGVSFGLSEASRKKLDEQRIAAAWNNLRERVAAIARAMGRNPADAVLDTIDFEGSGNYAPEAAVQKMTMRAAAPAAAVEEPSFEPGETTLQMRVVGRFRFR